MSRNKIIAASVLCGALLLGLLGIFHWSFNRFYVPEGNSLLLRYKGSLLLGSNVSATPGQWAEEGQVGILERLRGPGRHFYCPLWWERTIVPDVVVKPGEVGLVTCKLGDSLPSGEFLVDGEIGQTKFKGVLRKVLGPGRYRINPYGYEVKVVQTEKTESAKTVKHSGWVDIPIGYVGVVTNLADNPITGQKTGIQDKILPPGLYPMNPREQQVDIVGVGFWETSVNITSTKPIEDLVKADETTGADDGLTGGISFPSADGFKITMDFTAIWGLTPDQAPNAIRKFGNVDLVEKKVVLPQIESICRNNGSEYPAVKLLVGKERELFQNDTVKEFHKVLDDKQITLLYGLVRHIYIPNEVRKPIQMSFIADELKLTREQEQLTAQGEADLREAERKVELETQRVSSDTKRLVASRHADGQKVVGETGAETRKLVAAIEKGTAEFQSQAKIVIGQADSDGRRMVEQAKANKFKLAVEAFGTPAAYNNWVFATGLPEDIQLKLFYSGPGTLWTDLKDAVRINVPVPAQEEKK